jgi:hypothetical protein
MVDMIDARSVDGYTAIATQGNGIYSSYFDASLGVRKSTDRTITDAKLSPNPCIASTVLTYSLEHSGNVSIKIFDINGRRIREVYNGKKLPGTHLLTINTSELLTGTYLITMESTGKIAQVKLVKTD